MLETKKLKIDDTTKSNLHGTNLRVVSFHDTVVRKAFMPAIFAAEKPMCLLSAEQCHSLTAQPFDLEHANAIKSPEQRILVCLVVGENNSRYPKVVNVLFNKHIMLNTAETLKAPY